MVGMLAASGALEQLDRKQHRVWGKIEDRSVLAKVMSFIRATGALSKLKGQTYGNFELHASAHHDAGLHAKGRRARQSEKKPRPENGRGLKNFSYRSGLIRGDCTYSGCP